MSDLSIKDLTVEYRSGDYTLRPLDGFNLAASSGELVVLLGPSGSGKTTLLSCIAGIMTPARGSITVAGRDVVSLSGDALTEYRRSTVGIVFQAFNLIPSLTALENVAAPMMIGGSSRRSARDRAAILLERVGLADRAGHRPAQMSGGQQQRVAIARALVYDPPLLIADEPTAHLDYIQVEAVLTLMRGLASPGRLVVVATHDERFTPLADRTIHLAQRRGDESHSQVITLTAGDVVFRQSERGELIYVVESGEVEIFRERADGGEEPLAVIGKNNYFGELAPMLGLPRSASARAKTYSTLTAYTLNAFRDLAAKDARFARLFTGAPGLPAPPAVEPFAKASDDTIPRI